MKKTDMEEALRIIGKGAAEIIEKDELSKKLQKAKETGKPLKVKLGLDPTAPDLHLGHAVVLRKIRQLQDLGHHADIILGDFTGRIGDPSGKSKTRRQLTEAEVLENAATYKAQLFKIVDPEKTTICFNSQWLSKLNFEKVLGLAGKTTVARILERDDFKNRFEANATIGLHELFYPLMQAYDSVALKTDIEMGGTDQRFNILMGRDLQRQFGLEAQVALFMPLLEGVDGVEKMSKSLNNSIGINEPANVMFQKVMTIPDELIIRCFELCTDLHPDRVDIIKERLSSGENPRDVKLELAFEITQLYHDSEKAQAAREEFNTVFREGGLPEEITVVKAGPFMDGDSLVDLPQLLFRAGLAPSASEARRLIQQGGVKLDGKRAGEFKAAASEGMIVQVGRKHFIKLG